MKKFLSLVLALIMTMSLVTISAGATEYKDLTDKDEIQYEEAVAVLNRIGVITGYEDGSFRPETELTRGAAAKIIVSLMIGPDAASALPNNASPYPDVPAGHTFAGVIGYCKTAGYISGYGDGTFKPANPLTGYAFAKMLLGAIGYKSNIEGFVDTGWTMNVARIGNVAGLFDRLDFDGAKAVTRDEACQLALNTLKATMVDYGNSNTVVSSNGQVLTVQGSKAQYVTSNNRDINANINRRVISATNNELTLEFGEEHFKDLRLKHDRFDPAYDVYGHPSNEWSYKKVTIGTFPLPADFTFTKQMAHLEDTQATKEKALGLRGYDTYSTDHKGGYVNWSTAASDKYASSPFADATQIHINGWEARVRNSAYKQTDVPTGEKNVGQGNWYSYDAYDITSANKELAPSLSEICDLTDNGVTVEVYVCPVDADFITDVVVIRTQLMEVDRIASDYVELDTISSDSNDPRKDSNLTKIAGYNDYSLFDGVVSVKDNNYDAYNVLKELKSGDKVAVIPYTSDNGKTWEVGRAYVPETVSGTLTNVDIYNTKSKADGNAIAITVGGTTYPIAQWNKDMISIDGYKIKASKKDVTLLLDEMGNALLAKDVAASDNWIIVGDYYQATLSSGRVGWFVHGWTIKGDEVDLELGTIRGAAEKYAPGELVRYKVAEAGNGEYELDKPNYNKEAVWKDGTKADWAEPRLQDGGKDTGEGVYTISQYAYQTGAGVDNKYKIQSRNTLLPLDFYNTAKNADKPYDVIPGDRLDYSKATSQYDAVANGDKLGRGTDYYTEKDNLGKTVAAAGSGTTSFDHWFYKTAPYDGVKFIYVGFDTTNGEVETINVLDGVQNVEHKELLQINRWWKNVGTNSLTQFVASPAEAYVDKNGKVKAVVIKSDSAEANLKDLMIITDNKGTNTSLSNQKATIGAEAPTSGTAVAQYQVSEGAKVTVMETGSDTLTAADKTATVGTTEINLKTNSTGKDTLEFTMPTSDLTVNMTAKSTLANGDTAATETFSVTLHKGVTGTYKESSTATESKPLTAATGDTAGVTKVPNGAVITITGIDGAIAINQATPLAKASATASNSWAKDATITIAGNSVELWAATEVVFDSETKNTTPSIAASADVYVPIDTVLKPEKDNAGDGWTSFIAVTGTAKAAAEAIPTAGLTVSGADKISVYAGYKATLAEGLKVTIAGTDYTGTVYVDGATAIQPVATSSDQIAVLKTTAGQIWGEAATSAALTEDTEFLAMTKVILKDGKVDGVTSFSQIDGSTTTIVGAAVSGADKTIGVLANESITVTGHTEQDGYKMSVTTASGAVTLLRETVGETDTPAAAKATATFKVGAEAITVTEVAPGP